MARPLGIGLLEEPRLQGSEVVAFERASDEAVTEAKEILPQARGITRSPRDLPS
jgi:hypothetical protein